MTNTLLIYFLHWLNVRLSGGHTWLGVGGEHRHIKVFAQNAVVLSFRPLSFCEWFGSWVCLRFQLENLFLREVNSFL